MVINLNGSVFSYLLFLLIFVILACAPKPDEFVKAYAEASNSHDVDKVMSFYADDIRFEIAGAWVKIGKEEVRKIAEWDAATNIHMTISDIKVSGDTVTFKLTEINDWLRLAGVDEVYYEPSRMIFRNGLITVIEAELSTESAKIWSRAWQSIIAWASEEKKQDLAEVMPEGEFIFGADYARKWLVLLQEWREAIQPNK